MRQAKDLGHARSMSPSGANVLCNDWLARPSSGLEDDLPFFSSCYLTFYFRGERWGI
jgi:hypothetical protein